MRSDRIETEIQRTGQSWEVQEGGLLGPELRELKLQGVAQSYDFMSYSSAFAWGQSGYCKLWGDEMDCHDLRKAGWGRVGSAPRKQDLSAPGRKAVGSKQKVAGQQTLEECDNQNAHGTPDATKLLLNRIKGAKRVRRL